MKMGQRESTPNSPLDCILNNFSDFQRCASGYGSVQLDPEFLQTLCQLEWPTFGVGWPAEGTFNLPVLFAVQATVYRAPHPDQIVYIDVWVDIAPDKPGYIQKCLKRSASRRRTVLLAAGREKQKKSPERSAQREQRVPKLYPPLPGPGEDMLDPLNAPPPYPRREVPHSTQQEEGGTLASPPHTRGGARYGQEAPASPAPPALLPLREALPGPDAPAGAPPRLIYVPFSTSDLYNWKHQNPPFSEKPQGLISLRSSCSWQKTEALQREC